MPLTYKEPEYIIPTYNLTGDLLAFRKCRLRYRYYNKGSLPPSRPVQLWFGQFIHGVMEEAFNRWKHNPNYRRFPWDWLTQIRELELIINRRLIVEGLPVPSNIFCREMGPTNSRIRCQDTQHPHQLLASRRTEKAINTWGPHLFPLISEAEVKLQGIQAMPIPSHHQNMRRSDYFEISGIIDVISGVNLQNAPSGNLIVHKIINNQVIQNLLNQLSTNQYEIIIDYKGTRRPNLQSIEWIDHEWQILTYAWLRSLQTQAQPIVGVLFYLNELEPSQDDIIELQREINAQPPLTDIIPAQSSDRNAIIAYKRGQPIPVLTTPFRENRSVKIILIDNNSINQSLRHFRTIVQTIEDLVINEILGHTITNNWNANCGDSNTCTTCDFLSICPNPTLTGTSAQRITVP